MEKKIKNEKLYLLNVIVLFILYVVFLLVSIYDR